ncbi:MAG: carotenoid oxygenase family protein [Myxococcales bacterium]|jgi:hypothetical protein|nr:carotenoid oxygenase family protein [Myxococcales bacterium]
MSERVQDFIDRVGRGLVNTYHGDAHDHSARYVVRTGSYPQDLSGRTFTTVFPYQSIHEHKEIAVNPHMLTASGRLLTMDLEPLTDRNGTFIRVATRFIENQSWHLRKLAPEAFVRTDFAEFSWFGTSNLTNTAPVPAFPVLGQGGYEGRRVLLSYDAGRPVEVSPLTLEHLSPVGRSRDYHAAVGSSFSPMIMTSGHPVYDPDFEPGQPRLLYTNIVPRVADFLNVNKPIRADLYLMTWDGAGPPTPPMRVTVDGKPVILRHASVHQLCLTRNYLIVFNANLVLNTASLIEPLTPLLWRFLVEQRTPEVPHNLRVFYRWLRIRMREATPEHRCPVYFIHKDAIRKALQAGERSVPARVVELHWELTHALADYDDDDDIVTLFCQHNIGADPADQMEEGDRLVGGGTVPTELLGMFSSATDLNQVRRHVVDLRRGRVETRAFPEAGDRERFAYGLNLLPPLQVAPYLSEYADSDVPNLLRACRRMDATYWVAGGWLPQTMSTRVFSNFRRGRPDDAWPPRRMVAVGEFIERTQDPDNTVRFFRLTHDMQLESTYQFPPGWFMAAPIFVPRPGSQSVCDGYLLAQVWGPDNPDMELWIWDASRPLSDGPCCTLGPGPYEHGIRPGFPLHSSWVDRAGVENWIRPGYSAPTIEMPRYLKLLELGTIGAGVLRRLIQQRL